MQSLERRITALESQADSESGNLTVRLVCVEAGETNEQAIERAGHSPAEENTLFVCLVGLESATSEVGR